MDTNPYEPPRQDLSEQARRRGRIIALISFLVSAVPSLIMLYWLGEHFFALYRTPSTSYRPIIWIYGVGLSFLNALLCCPFPLLADRLGTKEDGDLALRSFYLAPVPTVLVFAGPFLICWATGSSFGS